MIIAVDMRKVKNLVHILNKKEKLLLTTHNLSALTNAIPCKRE